MKRLLCSALLGLSGLSAQAAVTVTDCVIREPAPGTDKTGLYFTVNYQPDAETASLRLPAPEALYGAAVPALTSYTELHDMTHVDGVMTMTRIPQVQVKPNTSLSLTPGGKHVMLFNLTKMPKAGEQYPVELWLAFDPNATCMAEVKTSAQIAADNAGQVTP
ncbi:copper chaperone PCu(A)C [Photobacterium aphoticum]|uniref:Molecular chaperone n=1 Tax=Photobacterium aphoticum TaxID=754436 RepID=A0A0J1GRI8_9GAMM|nr:copper chaperone PCu(A)C [Photobacterium aphoticum]KLV02281.1 molecular chaperone [Photobacterium aphoticum]PSU57736.1 copper chaperone PCu(A)C [Photobacterium aphoticum]GHA55187.1 hypothetical protein GCM10007086_31580 [Photobacterium aphoticum]